MSKVIVEAMEAGLYRAWDRGALTDDELREGLAHLKTL